MQKAYDVKDLVERFKAKGLEVAEECAKDLIEATFAWVEESAKLSATPYDDMGLVVLPKLKEMALSGADQIDGQVG